ncbi:MAG: response regulator transcription factor [Alphaproteobacteria bacterium]|nr:response regulator transcription factor [Alphaproteobacteria bacterium]
MKVLIIEDSQELAKSLRLFLELENNHVECAYDLATASHYISVTHFDIILLDIMLPDGDGRDFLRSVRARNKNIPVIVMTARSEISDRVDLLDIGADDYIIKPFEFVELEARCRAVLRRHSGQDQQALSYGNIILYPLSAMIEFAQEKTPLRNRELRLLEIFCNSPEILFSKEQLTDRLFLISDEVTENAIEVYVGRLRKKLVGSNVTIETVRGIGYRLVKDE